MYFVVACLNSCDRGSQNDDNISVGPPDLQSGAKVMTSIQDALLCDRHQVGAIEGNIRQIEA